MVDVVKLDRDRGRELLRKGTIAGLVGGAVLVLAQMVVAGDTAAPWRMFASIPLGREALTGPMTLGIFLLGFIVHFALSALFGLLWGLVARKVPPETRRSWGPHAGLAMAYGLALYLVNFQLIARAAFPWLVPAGGVVQAVLHVIAYGLPLGLALVAQLRTTRVVRAAGPTRLTH